MAKKGSKTSKELLAGANKQSAQSKGEVKDITGDSSNVPLVTVPSHGSKDDAKESQGQPGVSPADDLLCDADEPVPQKNDVCIGKSSCCQFLHITSMASIGMKYL